MTGYIASFAVYTSAMIGLICLAFIVAKKFMITDNFSCKKNRFLSVETSLSLAPRKTLYVVKAGNEKFLISSDAERTSFLTKLTQENVRQIKKKTDIKEQNLQAANEKTLKKPVGSPIKKTEALEEKSFMRKLLTRLEN